MSGRLYEPEGEGLAWLILAPGAGAGHDHGFMVGFGRGLAARGLRLVTFNFPYIERGRRVPDRNDTLESCWQSVLQAVRERAGATARVFAGGKSMGGRIASQVAARPEVSRGLDGLVFLGYPLHPPGQPARARTGHWPAIDLPALFIQGTRDPFAALDELRSSLPLFAGPTTLAVVEGGDHSFKVPKGKGGGRSQEAVYAEIQDRIVAWIAEK